MRKRNIYGNAPMTNADRIRAMSDEELAKHFLITGICQYLTSLSKGRCAVNRTCAQCVLDWLRQPAEQKGEK